MTFLLALLLLSQSLVSSAGDRVLLRFDTSEADAVLMILELIERGARVDAHHWQRVFDSEPYVRLKQREEMMRRPFTEDDFRSFVLAQSHDGRAGDLRQTLKAWGDRDLESAARRVLEYLPSDARIHATVYPVIKPQTNSFVFDVRENPAIFLYLDANLSAAQFENTIAHELHHIGFASVERPSVTAEAGYPEAVRAALGWMGALGEGFAMLAAAGGPDAHPHEASPPEVRARWDRDVAGFNDSLRDLERFFLDVIEGRLSTDEDVRAKGFTFFGEQGPWYTVGYVMATTVERRFGRHELIAGMADLPRLLRAYNGAAAEQNEERPDALALWSNELLAHFGVF